MRRNSNGRTSTQELLAQTQALVTRLVRENRDLKARNLKLSAELERLSKGWEQIRKLAGQAPRLRRR